MAVKTKRAFQRAIRTTITLPPRLMEGAESIFTSRGFSGFSAYVQELIRQDVDARKPELLTPR